MTLRSDNHDKLADKAVSLGPLPRPPASAGRGLIASLSTYTICYPIIKSNSGCISERCPAASAIRGGLHSAARVLKRRAFEPPGTSRRTVRCHRHHGTHPDPNGPWDRG